MKPALAIAMPPDQAVALPVSTENAKPGAPWPAPARDKCTAVTVSDFALLDGIIDKWEDLAANAVEPNPFYEHRMLRRALAHLGAGVDLRVVLIFAPNRARPAEPLLSGVFPLERRPRHHRLPCRTLSLWRHKFCQMATPLIRATHAEETMAAFFAWLAAADHGCALMEFSRVSGEGAFHHLFVDYLDHHAVLHDASGCFLCRVDSFTSRDDATFIRLWRDRVLLRDVTVGTGSRRGDFIVSLLPLLRWLKRRTSQSHAQ